MELREALEQISEIRRQVAQTEVFRGYRAVPVAFSGALALGAAGVQALCIPEPLQNLSAYLALWLGAACLSMLSTGIEMAWNCHRSPSGLTRPTTILAVSQFLPCLAVGGLLTFILINRAADVVWMLPGLWSVLFSLGIFASYRLLPPATFWVAVHYLIAGALCLAWAQGEWALSPWAMGLPFGIGQLFAAGVLYWTLERSDVEKEETD